MKDKKNVIIPVLVFTGLLVLWQAAVMLWNIPKYVLPSPIDTMTALIKDITTILRHARVTVIEAAAGMLISFAVSIVLGICMDLLPAVKAAVYPILVVTQTVPMIVLAPLLMIYMGFGMAPKLLTVVLMCFFPIVVSFADGMACVDKDYLNLLRSYGANRLQEYTLVKIPASIPSLLSGLKMAATYSISGAVVGEWVASKEGLGWYLVRVKTSYERDKVFASVLAIILLSLLMNAVIRLLGYLIQPKKKRRKTL